MAKMLSDFSFEERRRGASQCTMLCVSSALTLVIVFCTDISTGVAPRLLEAGAVFFATLFLFLFFYLSLSLFFLCFCLFCLVPSLLRIASIVLAARIVESALTKAQSGMPRSCALSRVAEKAGLCKAKSESERERERERERRQLRARKTRFFFGPSQALELATQRLLS